MVLKEPQNIITRVEGEHLYHLAGHMVLDLPYEC